MESERHTGTVILRGAYLMLNMWYVHTHQVCFIYNLMPCKNLWELFYICI